VPVQPAHQFDNPVNCVLHSRITKSDFGALLASTITFAFAILVIVLMGGNEARADCVLGNSLGSREFSLPRNGVCLIRRSDNPTIKQLSMRVTVKPKLGTFGKASLSELAYRAGPTPGDDYFEYVAVISLNGGLPREMRIRNTVHIR
jgi:hypothetical protein